MPQPTPSDVHVNGPLTNLSVAYIQSATQLISTRVFPNIPVAKQGDLFFSYTREDWNRIVSEKRAPGTESVGSGYSLTTDSYFADVWAIHKDVDDQTRANSDAPLNPDRDATEWVTIQNLLRREKEWATAFFAQSIWGTDREGVAAAPTGTEFLQFNDASSTPVEVIRADIRRILLATGMKPNKLILGLDTFNSLIDHPDIIDRIKGAQVALQIGEPELARLWRLDEVLVAEGIENTAAEGATESNTFLVDSKSALLVFAQPSPGLYKPSGGYTFSWTGLLGAGPDGSRIKKFRVEPTASDRIEGELAFDQKLVASDLGVFYYTAVA